MAIRVLLVYDSALVRDGLKALFSSTSEIEDEIEVVGHVCDASAAVIQTADRKPDVVLMDTSFQIIQASNTVCAIREEHPEVGIVMLSRYRRDAASLHLLHYYADVVLHENEAGREKLLQVIYAASKVRAGRKNSKAQPPPVRRRKLNGWECLSLREQQVFKLVLEGKSSPEISRMVGLSPKTVQTYRARVMRKLDVRDFSGLIKFGLEYGLTSFR